MRLAGIRQRRPGAFSSWFGVSGIPYAFVIDGEGDAAHGVKQNRRRFQHPLHVSLSDRSLRVR